jgi:serine/threonine-protein kinase
MAAVDAERNLLFGLLALQTGLIQQAQLVAAFHAWTCDKARPLADHLIELGHLNAAQRSAVEALAALHVEAHGGDLEQSLAAIPAGKSTHESLARLGDPDVEATLGHLGSGHGSTEDSAADFDRTATYSVGMATADGQRFRVLRPHATGGLGAVFVALDTELHREVALKQILDSHADDPTSRARFLLEAEVTGGLEHPGIVPVYGLGAHTDGRPYYAMRFIRGDSLKEAIDRFHADEMLKHDPGRRSLELRKLLRRFTDVCNAIEYAHSRGVLHRDIKPGNIIVGKHGETLVVDWGLAKATGKSEPTAEERTLRPSSASGSADTLPGSALGTPAYMSPEQACGNLESLGRRSDIYSLGATLYCLLTGHAPFTGGPGEILRAVQQGEFRPPRTIDPLIDKALEAVCLKAMAFQPEDRYTTPRLLAEDIERWMADEPVTAWREPVSRRLLRWLTRHRTGVTAAGAALLVALAGTGAVLAVQTRANTELKRSNVDLAIANQKVTRANSDLEAANDRVRQRFDLAMDAINLFHGEVSEDLLLKEKEFEVLRARLLKGAAGFYGKLEQLLEGQADRQSRAALGRAYFELGKLTLEIGTKAESATVHRKGLAVRRELAGSQAADDEATLDVVRSLRALAYSLQRTADVKEGWESVEEAFKLAEGLIAAGRGSDEAKFELAECIESQEAMVDTNRPLEEAVAIRRLEMARRALAIAQELDGKNPGVTRYLKLLAASRDSVGLFLDHLDRRAEALAAHKEAAEIYQRLVDAQPEAWQLQNSLAKLHNNITNSLRSLGKFDEAVASQRQALAIWRRAADANPAVKSLSNNVAFGLTHLAICLSQTGRPAEALEALAQARPIWQKLADADSRDLTHPHRLANNYLFAGDLLAQMGMRREANEAYEKAVAVRQKMADEHPSHSGIQSGLASSLGTFGWRLWEAGRTAEAVAAYGRERTIWQRMVAAGPGGGSSQDQIANCETNTAAALSVLGRLSEARACCDRAIAIREDLVKGDPKNDDYALGLAESLLRSGSVRAAAGDLAAAAADYRRAAALYANHPPVEQHAILRACCHGALAGLASKNGSGLPPAEATAQANEAMAILRQAVAGGYRDIDHLRVEPGLQPLSSRDDFRLLLMDQAFPVEPFAR